MELQVIHQKILVIRGQKVMLDFDLAELYEVQTKVLNQAVKRNIDRFPDDFMFQLTAEEWRVIANRSQIVTGSQKHGESKSLPYAFTEQGVAMLSSVLRSKKAIEVNITIMRTFVMLRRYALTYDELAQRIEELEAKYGDVNEVLNQLLMGAGNRNGTGRAGSGLGSGNEKILNCDKISLFGRTGCAREKQLAN